MTHLDPVFLPGLFVPLGGIFMIIVIIMTKAIVSVQQRHLSNEQRMAMLQRGLSIPDIERLLRAQDEPETPRDPRRRLTNTRTWALLLFSLGLGSILFFVVLALIVDEKRVLSGAAASLVPLVIGIGLFVDYRLQARYLARLGLLPPTNAPDSSSLP